ncbi:tRNA-intron endonuclease [Rhodotorula diobovata]|uniref:tRNA-splicing endonuclease subunit Sen2 n=1 Tax=Rhodotorula diobovata TaxID=5288 RepID=A0A5C5G776_9BASI|nr:tRNA-intron endonuclease [Rhodotorula diobovata]
MAATRAPPPPATATATTTTRINATRPENLAPSAKRTSKAQLLQQYLDLLPLKPAPESYLDSLRSALHLPQSHLSPATTRVDAQWDPLTLSVWVTNDAHMTRLWRQGFFGKGFLSRSEPSWRRRVDNRRAHLDGRQKRLTAEEVTALRRIERKGTKLAKKLERDAERLLAASTAASAVGSPAPAVSPLPDLAPRLEQVAEEQERAGDNLDVKDKGKGKEVPTPTTTAAAAADDDDEADEQDPPPPAWQLDAEHSQLQPEEAFFLIFALDALSLTVADPLASPSPSGSPASPPPRLSILSSFRLFLQSACPSLPPTLNPPSGPDPRLARLDSPFLLSYAVYHHYRSMSWVVRSGVKFCVDWVLYGQGGPVGGHAEFAVLVLPTYVDPADAASNPFRSHSALALHQAGSGGATGELEHLEGEGERKNSWRWFHTVNRVCSGVKKTLVLAHVVIPPLSSLPATHSDPEWVARHPAQALARLEVREVVVRRFLAGRMRD